MGLEEITYPMPKMLPENYAGGESITFPNGLILKIGVESVAANTVDDVTYETAFPTAFVVAFATYKHWSNTGITNPCIVFPKSGSETTILQVGNGDNSTKDINWAAIGY